MKRVLMAAPPAAPMIGTNCAAARVPAQLAEWRGQLPDDGDHLDPTLAQIIAPKLIDEVERLRAELGRARRQLAAEEAAALEKRLTDASTHGGECRTCNNAEARAALVRLRAIAGGKL